MSGLAPSPETRPKLPVPSRRGCRGSHCPESGACGWAGEQKVGRRSFLGRLVQTGLGQKNRALPSDWQPVMRPWAQSHRHRLLGGLSDAAETLFGALHFPVQGLPTRTSCEWALRPTGGTAVTLRLEGPRKAPIYSEFTWTADTPLPA